MQDAFPKMFQSVAVIGAGSMGCGIAGVIAMSGIAVKIFDMNGQFCEEAVQKQKDAWRGLWLKNKIDEAKFIQASKNLVAVNRLSELFDVDLVIEAIVENQQHKQSLFEDLERICKPSTIFASNTSSLSITALSKVLKNPKRLIGLHFFNPPARMRLVEIVTGLNTAQDLIGQMQQFSKMLNKISVITRSTPGFIVNRVARPFYAESLRILKETRADTGFEDRVFTQSVLDQALRVCGQFPMGAFELMDLIGHDVNFAVTESVHQALFYDAKFRPSGIQKELVDAGFLGRKSGRGFYDYEPETGIQLNHQANQTLALVADDSGLNAVRTVLDSVKLNGDFGHASSLITRIEMAGIKLEKSDFSGVFSEAYLDISGIRMYLQSGKTATQLSIETGHQNIIVLDLAKDYLNAKTLAVSFSDAFNLSKIETLNNFFADLGIVLLQIPDVAGGVVMRTVAMLINIACDVVEAGIASIEDVDLAMKYGTNHPIGPFEWANLIGFDQIVEVLMQLQIHYADSRYRQGHYLKQQSLKLKITKISASSSK